MKLAGVKRKILEFRKNLEFRSPLAKIGGKKPAVIFEYNGLKGIFMMKIHLYFFHAYGMQVSSIFYGSVH